MPRALASARGVLGGIADAREAAGEQATGEPVTPVFFRKHFNEIIYPNWGVCARLKQLSSAARHEPDLVAAQDALKWRAPELFGLQVSLK